ncbi:MAG: HEAT repeat domain-containing protein [Limisphaerales bacterium]
MELPQQINGTQIPYDAPLEILLEQIKSHLPETGAAFVALAAKGSEQSLAALVSAAKGKDADFRRAAIEAIANHSLGIKQAKLICDLFQDSDEIVVRAACRAAANLKLSKSHNQIFALLNSKNPKTREVALEALDKLWLDSDFEQVFKIHTTDKNSNVRKRAAWTLRRNVARRNWKILFEVWQKDEMSRHRVWACELAAQFGSVSNLSVLNKLFDDQDGHVGKAAKKAIGILK